ncbi:PucC family protein [Yoonia sediminilitoris]|uniref:BCD family chlorophyll transporter-like MFS transporter n=1 Tax=Yoonia sediminilitoris TaxID=1286148 RepID=A0A2T6KMH7_9RHOB|nr:PucC family protein [Yoonia sediminilitoris]PUB17425.1 BCD family chlorophyll transporter-like MFS transporter [Yoonia sediminilitoris]RCW97720.1 BCD family chlorophyll transporter-like MFS transporter [Yoonia sediminilitoris]
MIFRASSLKRVSLNLLPFSDAVSDELPLGQLLRLSLFQISVGMAAVMLLGTLNRVMIVELGIGAMLVAAMIAIPVLVAPFRALVGHKSDNYKSAIGWKRIPYLWFGTMWQFGGLAIMPMALLVLSGDRTLDMPWAGYVGAALAFLLTGLGMHMTQTAGLALAADRASDETRPRVVALLYVMNLVGMAFAAIIIGALLRDYSALRLVQVIQGTAVVTLLLNLTALWKQEKVQPMTKAQRAEASPTFRDAWTDLAKGGDAGRLLVVAFLGTMAFNMQDVLLEPYGGEILGLSVSATTLLTAMWAFGALLGFGLAARWLAAGMDPYRMAARGILAGVLAFCAVIFSHPVGSPVLFYLGAGLIGFGGGLFGISTLTAAMTMPAIGNAGRGLALGAWGAAQATGAGLSIFIGGTIRDLVNHAAGNGTLGEALATPATGYSVVYHTEIGLLFITLIVLGPLVRLRPMTSGTSAKLGLADFPT